MRSQLGRWLGLLPTLKAISRDELERSLAAAGFVNEHVWQPDGVVAVFAVSRKPADTPSSGE